MQSSIVFGKYQLFETLARGGMGEVWKARSCGVEGFEKVLVIKRILPALSRDPRFVQLFVEEAKVAVALTHANIVQVFDLGVEDNVYFIAMEYVPGWDLARVLEQLRREGTRLPVSLCLYLASELAKGLDYAHRRRDAELRPLGIVHCDVSPSNVLLSREGNVKLTDFGIARTRATAFPPHERPLAKFAYLAPEQAAGGPVDARADVFSVGAILFELLSGQPSIVAATREEAFQRALKGEHDGLPGGALALSQDVVRVVERAMAQEPDQRHASAGELYEELLQLLFGTGRRVGARDMAMFLQGMTLSGATAAESSQGDPLSGIEEIFADAGSGLMSSGGLSRAPAPPAPHGSAERAAFAPRPEWREASLLAVEGLGAEVFAELIGRYGGEVLPPAAEGERTVLFGLFGVGSWDGRDAHAACRAGLRALRDQAAQATALVHSGRLLVDAHGRAEPDAALDLLCNEALRWLRAATPFSASASPAAARSLRGQFELVPGSPDTPQVFLRELRADERLGRFVGRRDELRAVGEALATANRGDVRVVGVHGDVGSGKSRLIAETGRRLRHAGHDVGLHVATCEAHEGATPWYAIQASVRAVIGADDLAPEADLREKLDRLRLLGLSTRQRVAIDGLLGLQSAETEGAIDEDSLADAFAQIIQKLSEDRLTVLAWDGAELMDERSLALLAGLLRHRSFTRVVFLLTYRPTERQPWAQWPSFVAVELKPLSEKEVERLVRHRLKVSEVPPELVSEVAERAAGNPLYIDELLGAIVESEAISVTSGVVQLQKPVRKVELPRTLRGLVAARAGRLSAQQRSLLQLAATFETHFSPELLAAAAKQDEAAVQRGLTLLVERGILRSTGASDYTFAHDLSREVLEQSISEDQHPALHARVAAALEASGGQASFERLAYHHRQAGSRKRAIQCLMQGAEAHEREHATDAAIEAYMQVLDLLSQRRERSGRRQILDVYTRLAEVGFRSRAAELVADRLSGAVELSESLGRETDLARFSMLRGRLLNRASRFLEGRKWLEKAQALARKHENVALQRDVALFSAEAYVGNGEFNAAIQHVREALELSRKANDPRVQVQALSVAAPAYAAVGRMDLAAAAIKEIDTLIGQRGDRYQRVEELRVRALVQSLGGEPQDGADAARLALELAREYDMPFEVASLACLLATVYLRSGDGKRAFASLQQSYDIATEHGFARLQWLNACLLGFLDAMRFKSEAAHARMVQSLRYAEERSYVWDIIIEKYVLAMVEQKLSRPEASAQLLADVAELSRSHGHRRMTKSVEQALSALDQGSAIPAPR